MLFKCRSDVKIVRIEDLGIVIDNKKETCYIVNQTATWLLSMMSEFVSLEDLSALAKEKYTIEPNDNLFTEIEDIMIYLSNNNVIEVQL
ncbi:hypothetical protein [Gloeothece verrucosa]|uniref:Coenzyme PQQ synthesis D n=1 Tax=Gloeothece verrucosa (strain PCC 7822) TaxID=497965 RepID=E0U8S2_GLOV7|nr:hypothetical protein [Gloeothece verrucosa]ADN14936.1 hypothetical protein Cyan7822_2979 [Gloeothece verrucosa PCC 7822]